MSAANVETKGTPAWAGKEGPYQRIVCKTAQNLADQRKSSLGITISINPVMLSTRNNKGDCGWLGLLFLSFSPFLRKTQQRAFSVSQLPAPGRAHFSSKLRIETAGVRTRGSGYRVRARPGRKTNERNWSGNQETARPCHGRRGRRGPWDRGGAEVREAWWASDTLPDDRRHTRGGPPWPAAEFAEAKQNDGTGAGGAEC